MTGPSHPGQCCPNGYCWDEVDLHDVPQETAEKIKALLARETDEYDQLLTRQSDILTRTANVLKGDPPPRTSWSHHDLPEVAWAAIAPDCAGRHAPLTVEQIADLLPTPAVSHFVADWPQDEQDFARHGAWDDFEDRAAKLNRMRRLKTARTILHALQGRDGAAIGEGVPVTTTPADADVPTAAEIDDLRHRAQRAEQQLALVHAERAGAAQDGVNAAGIADEHWFTNHRGFHCVGCGWAEVDDHEDYGHATRRHIAEVTERAVRARVVADLTREAGGYYGTAGPQGENRVRYETYRHAAEIAEGGTR